MMTTLPCLPDEGPGFFTGKVLCVALNKRELDCCMPCQSKHAAVQRHACSALERAHIGGTGQGLVARVALAANAPAAPPQVCMLADLDYDVFHATVDNRSGIAEQEYFARPRFGEGAAHAVVPYTLSSDGAGRVARR